MVVKELAELAGVSCQNVRNYITRGDLPAERVPADNKWGFVYDVKDDDACSWLEQIESRRKGKLPEPAETAEIAAGDILKEEYLTTEQAAKILNVRTNYVTKLIREGRLQAYRVGGLYRIPKKCLVKRYEIEKIMDVFGISRSTIDRHIRQGLLKAERVGKKTYVDEDALREYIKPAGDGV